VIEQTEPKIQIVFGLKRSNLDSICSKKFLFWKQFQRRKISILGQLSSKDIQSCDSWFIGKRIVFGLNKIEKSFNRFGGEEKIEFGHYLIELEHYLIELGQSLIKLGQDLIEY
jgi:hypothetical protein